MKHVEYYISKDGKLFKFIGQYGQYGEKVGIRRIEEYASNGNLMTTGSLKTLNKQEFEKEYHRVKFV
jgi:hypothetical protein